MITSEFKIPATMANKYFNLDEDFQIKNRRFSLSDGHEQEQSRRDGIQVVIGFYKYVDPDGKSRQIC